jgi:hypothetical protein
LERIFLLQYGFKGVYLFVICTEIGTDILIEKLRYEILEMSSLLGC